MGATPGAFRSETSRWLRDGEPSEGRNRIVRAILSRFWYVLLPFLGILAADGAYVRPRLKETQSLIRLEQKQGLRQVGDVRLQAGVVRAEYVAVRVAIDTLLTPRVAAFHAVIDSLEDVRLTYEANRLGTEQRDDSLRLVRDEILAENERLARAFARRSAALDSVNAWSVHLQDSLLTLDDRVARRTDELYRLRNPKEARRAAASAGAGRTSGRAGEPAGEGK